MKALSIWAAAMLLATTVQAAEWPCFRGPNRDGHTDEKITIWPPVEVWRTNVGQGFSQTVVSKGKVYTFGWADNKATLRCFSEDTTGTDPKPLWSTSYPCEKGRTDYPGTYPTPAVAGGRVYTSDNFGFVKCFDANTGESLWENATFQKEGGDEFGGSPLIEGDLVVVNSGAGGIAAGAISRTTHEVVWGTSDSGSRYTSPFVAEIGGKRQIIGYGKNVTGIDPATGKELWHFPFFHFIPGGGIANALIIGGEMLFASQGYNGGTAMAKLGGSGLLKKSWSNFELCTKVNSPVYYDGYVYGVAEDPAKSLRCIDPATGERKWSSADSEKEFGTESAVLSAGDQIIVIAGHSDKRGCGHLVVVEASPSAYKELYRSEKLLSGYTWVAPTLCNGKLYLRSQDGTIVCYEVGVAPVDGYSIKIAFEGYDKDETLKNFPALVALSPEIDGFEYSQFATEGGGDLRFAASDGTTELNYEIDTWNPEGTSYVWVQIPELTAGTFIWAFWGNAGLTAPPYTTNGATWDSTFAGVWHMGEAVSKGGQQRDSTANGNDGVFTATGPSVAGTPAVIGGGNHIASSGGVKVADSESLHVLNHVTMSIWAKSNDSAGWQGDLISKRGDLAMTPHPGNGAKELMFAAYTNSGRKGCYYTPPDIGKWHLWAGTYDSASGNSYIYCDGYNDPATNMAPGTGGAMHITSALPIGNGEDIGFGYNPASPGGTNNIWLDEARLENVVRSANWMWATYMTMGSHDTFQKYGVVQGSGFIPMPGALQFTSATFDGMENADSVSITLARVDGSSGSVACAYSVTGGSASAGSDFASASGSVEFLEGQTEAKFTVALLNDGDTEPDETVNIALSNPTGGASLGSPSRAVLTILDDDRPTFVFANAESEVSSQTERSALITVKRTKIAAGAVSIRYSTADGTAAADSDYVAATGTLDFADGETSKSFGVTIVRDEVYEPDETVKLTLSDPSGGAVLGGLTEAVLTIVAPPMATIFDDWSDRMKITFSGYTKNAELTNFPALIIFNSKIPGFSYRRFASASGGDLRFADASGKRELKYEIDQWNPNGDSHVWVQIPKLEKGTSIWAFWGNRNQATAPDYTTNGGAWDSAFVGVWHMDKVLTPDSTANGLDATGTFGNTTAAGLIGDAQSFASAQSTRMVVPHDDKMKFGPGDAYVLSAWAYVPEIPTGWHAVVTKSRDVGKFYGIYQYDSSWVYGCEFGIWNGGRIKKGAWNHVQIFQNPEDHSRGIYLNGALTTSAQGVNASMTGTGDLWFGGGAGTTEYFDGLLDEVRIERVPRSKSWIWACYMTMGSNAEFTVYGPARMAGGGR